MGKVIEIKDSKGNRIGKYRCLFDYPDDYFMHPFFKIATDLEEGGYISQNAALERLTKSNPEEFPEDDYLKINSLAQLSLQYVVSARALRKAFYDDKTEKTYNRCYFQPCAFLCRHGIELRLKELIYKDSNENTTKTHDIIKLWGKYKEIHSDCKELSYMDNFISEISRMDKDGMHQRYPFDNSGSLYHGCYTIDINALVDDTLYFYEMIDFIPFKNKVLKEH